MGKAKEIAEGWANYIFNRQEEVSELRTKICEGCEWHSSKRVTHRPDVHCTKCGCTLAAKTRSLGSECPIGKWAKIKNDGQE